MSVKAIAKGFIRPQGDDSIDFQHAVVLPYGSSGSYLFNARTAE